MPITLPAAELKFSEIVRTDAMTSLLVRLYRVDDGGLDVNGAPLYVRTLKRERRVTLDASISMAQIVAAARARLFEWAQEEGFNLPPERLICSL